MADRNGKVTGVYGFKIHEQTSPAALPRPCAPAGAVLWGVLIDENLSFFGS